MAARFRRTAPPVAGLSAVSTALVALALANPGYSTTDVELHDSGVWVTRASEMQLGRFNYEAQAVDGAVVGGSTALDVLQDEGLVLLVDPQGGTVSQVDPAAVEPAGSVSLPDGARVELGGGTAAVWVPGGSVWALPADGLMAFDPESEPVAAVADGGDVAVGIDGTVLVADPAAATLTSVRTEAGVPGGTSTRSLGVGPDGPLEVTAVGRSAVVLERETGTLHLPDATVTAPGEDARLQEPGAAAGAVAVATSEGLRLQPLGGGEPQVVGASGTPAPPVRVGACTYGAWSTGDVVRLCDGDEPYTDTLPATSGDLRYRVNRGYVVLNDLATGTVWLADLDYVMSDEWDDLAPAEDSSAEETDDAATETERILAERDLPNRPPVAADDTFGVRPGRTTILTVLDNDTDPDGDVLAATPDGDTPLGQVQAIGHGAGLQVAVPDDATGSATFDYTLDDGRGGSDTASVTLTVRAPDQNGAPVQLRSTRASVGQGGTVEVDVLGDWRDPDGDVLQLVGAATSSAGDSVRSAADGTLTFLDGGVETGAKTVTVQVTDGRETTEGTVEITVLPPGQNLPPFAAVDHLAAVAGREASIRPLDNDTDPNGDQLRLARVDDVAGVSLDRNLEAGTITFTAATAGVYYLTYLVTDGPAVAVGLVRVDVAPVDAVAGPPVAVRDRALLPSDGSVLVDVLANDVDPTGGVLVLQSAAASPGAGVSVAVLDHAVLRLSAVQPGPQSFTVAYTVSNGQASTRGEVVVLPVTREGESQSPQATEDEVTVRAGDVATIDVLANDTHPDGLPITVEPELAEAPDTAAGTMFVSEGVVRFQAGTTPQTVYATYTVRDAQGHKDSAQITVHVTPVDAASNAAPTPVTVTARVLSGQRSRIAIPLAGIDPDGDSVQLDGISRAPGLGRVTAVGDGWVEYEAARGATGTDSFAYTVTDRLGASADGVVLVGIAPQVSANAAPVAVDDHRATRPSREISVPVLANDVDPEGGTLGFYGRPEASDGLTVEIEGDRLLVRTPAEPGTYAVRYGVSDGVGHATGVLTVEVTPDAPTQPPIARDDRLSPADVVGRAQVEVAVLENDEDPDGSVGTLTVTADVLGVTARAGVLSVPVLATAQAVRYTVTDPDGLRASAFVWVPGTDGQRPTLRADLAPLTVVSGEELRVDLAEVVVVADGRVVRVTQAERLLALRGVAGLVDDHTVSFVSDPGYYGPAALTVEVIDTSAVDDPTGRRATLSLPIDVTPSGHEPPELLGLAVGAALGEETSVELGRYASDPNGDPLTFRTENVPAALSVRVAADGVLTLEPAAGTPVGTVLTFTVVASDGESETAATATVTVTASGAPLATVVDDVVADANQGETYQVPVLDNDVSPIPGERLEVAAVLLESGTADVRTDSRTVTVTPAATFVGTVVVAYTVADATGDPSRQVVGRVRLTVRGVPDAPGTPTVVEVRSHTAVLSWAPPRNNGAEITGYEVSVLGEGGGTRACPATTCTIDGLTNDRPYRFTVVAVNEVGPSEPSAQSGEIRPDAVPDPPAPPTLVFGDHSVSVSWSNRDYGGERSAIASVTLEISPPPSSGIGQRAGVTGTSIVWDGLDNGTAYRVRVQAVNNAGPSDWSAYSAAEIPAGVPDAPGTPTTSMLEPVGGSAQMLVSWAAPASDNGDAVKRYTLQVFHGGALPEQTLDVGTALSQAVTVSTSETPYTYRVVATNKAGDSAPSAPSAPRQAVVPPGAVTGLTASATGGNGTLALAFGDAPRNGATAGQMSYQVSLNGGGWGTLAGNRQVGGLANGTAYSVQVRAVSTVDGAQYVGPAVAAGYTGYNSSGSGVAPYGPLAAPSASATASGTAVQLSATATANGCGVTLHYRVDGGGWQTAASSWSGSVGNGYNQTHSIEAYATDGCGQQSAGATASATTRAPARTWVTRNGSVLTYHWENLTLPAWPDVTLFRCWRVPPNTQQGSVDMVASVSGSFSTSTGSVAVSCPGANDNYSIEPWKYGPWLQVGEQWNG